MRTLEFALMLALAFVATIGARRDALIARDHYVFDEDDDRSTVDVGPYECGHRYTCVPHTQRNELARACTEKSQRLSKDLYTWYGMRSYDVYPEVKCHWSKSAPSWLDSLWHNLAEERPCRGRVAVYRRNDFASHSILLTTFVLSLNIETASDTTPVGDKIAQGFGTAFSALKVPLAMAVTASTAYAHWFESPRVHYEDCSLTSAELDPDDSNDGDVSLPGWPD